MPLEPDAPSVRVPLVWRVFLGTALVVVAVLAGSLLLTARAAERTAGAAATRGIEGIRAQVNALLDGRSRGLLDGARVFAQTPGFRSLVGTGRRADALDQSREAAERLGATWVQIVDARGVRLAKSDAPDAPAEPLGGTALLRRALDGEAVAAYGVAGDTLLFHAVAVPVESGTPGRPAGALMATRLLDAAAAHTLGAAAGGDVVFYTLDAEGRARVGASTLAITPALRGAAAAFGGATAPATIALGDEQYYALATPLRSADGRPLGGVAVLHSQTAELRPFRELERTMLLTGLAGLGLALLVSFAVARQITRPVARLIDVARRGAAGDYAADVGVRSRDEVGVLADALGTMLADLREKQVLVEFARLTPVRGPRYSPSGSLSPVRAGPTAPAVPVEDATARVSRDDAAAIGEEVVSAATFAATSAPTSVPTPPAAPSAPAAPLDAFAATAALRLGEQFAGRYAIHHMIGAGGAGVVFRATDRRSGDAVAVKVLRPDVLTSDPLSLERLAREVDIARRLAHPNIVRVHELGEADGLHYLTMEYVEGKSLRQIIDERGELPVDGALTMARQLCQALAHAHERGVIHRDVKPHNLVVTPLGTLKVMDFGTARLAEGSRGLTESGVLFGTPAYMAPELLRSGPIDGRSDIYSAGVVLYEALVGRPPFVAGASGGSPMAVLTQVLETAPVDPVSLNPRVPHAVADVVLRALAKSPADRPQTAAAFAAELEGAAAGRGA